MYARTNIHAHIHTFIDLKRADKHTNPIYIHTYTHTYIHTQKETLKPRSPCEGIYIYIHTFMHTYVQYLPISTYGIKAYIHTYIHTYKYTYIHIHIHT